MELLEIKDLFAMDPGAPAPIVIANDNDLFIVFYVASEESREVLVQRDSADNTGVVVIKFRLPIRHSFGSPNDEVLHGHPYYPLGLRPYSFYELKNSDLIQSLERMNQVHPRYDSSRGKNFRHYILTFKDNMFECVAQGFEIRKENTSVYKQALFILNELTREL